MPSSPWPVPSRARATHPSKRLSAISDAACAQWCWTSTSSAPFSSARALPSLLLAYPGWRSTATACGEHPTKPICVRTASSRYSGTPIFSPFPMYWVGQILPRDATDPVRFSCAPRATASPAMSMSSPKGMLPLDLRRYWVLSPYILRTVSSARLTMGWSCRR